MSDTGYQDWSALKLLEHLELSGELPDVALLREIVQRGDEVKPGLLDMLSRGTLPHWAPNDPRWYRDVHAGLLLIEMRDESALPMFDIILRDPERNDVVDRSFEPWLPEYGSKIVPLLVDLAMDQQAWLEGRVRALRLLGVVGVREGQVRPTIVEALRRLLPAIRANGNVVLPDAADRISAHLIEIWSWAASGLADLADRESLPRVDALFRLDLLDEDVTGGVDEFVERIEEAERGLHDGQPFAESVITFYENLHQWSALSDQDLVETLYKRLLEAGYDLETAGELKQEMAEMLADQHMAYEPFADDEGFEKLESLRDELRALGISEEAMDDTITSLLMNVDDTIGDLTDEQLNDLLASLGDVPGEEDDGEPEGA